MSRSRLRRIPALSTTAAIAVSAILLALAPSGLAPALRAAESADATVDWPQFRGGSQTGMSPEKGLLHSWPEGGPKVVWKQAIGEGFSAVNAVGGFLYTMAADGDKETALCLEEATGKLVWRTPLDAKFVEEFGNGPRSTPAVAGGRVHALSSGGKLVALKAKDGAKIWEVDIVASFGSKVPTRGFSPSIVVDGDLVLLEVGGKEPGKAIAAFDAATGKVRWTALDGRPGYTTPLAVTIDGVRQYVFVTSAGGEIVSLRTDGQVHWRHAWSPGALASALFLPPNRIFASAADDVGSVLVEVTKADGKPVVKEVWKNRVMKNHFSSSVLVDGHIYGFDNASLKCVDPATGEQKWVQRGFGKGSLIAADGLLFVLSDRGALVLVEATPEAYREKGRTQVLEGKTWTAPSLANGKLYLRDHDELVVLDVKGNPTVAQPSPVGR